MRAHERNAFAVARFLDGHPRVRRVYYPGLEGHAGHRLAGQQQTGFGGVVSFDLETEALDAGEFFSRLTLIALAESLGGVESLAEHPWTMSHGALTEESRRLAGISPSTIRLSLGIEDPRDLVADLERALA
jgi:cystathionine beta-lyase/cystathionine gamma-synthase